MLKLFELLQLIIYFYFNNSFEIIQYRSLIYKYILKNIFIRIRKMFPLANVFGS